MRKFRPEVWQFGRLAMFLGWCRRRDGLSGAAQHGVTRHDPETSTPRDSNPERADERAAVAEEPGGESGVPAAGGPAESDPPFRPARIMQGYPLDQDEKQAIADHLRNAEQRRLDTDPSSPRPE